MASRLADDPKRTVLLLEAGPYYGAAEQWPEELVDGFGIPRTADWEYASEPLDYGVSFPLRRGKVIGGSTAVNYCVTLRGRPVDHDAWGMPDWSWHKVLPTYESLERHPDDPPARGKTPIRRYSRKELTDSQERFLAACETTGYPLVDDLNAPYAVGAGLTPLNQVDGIRHNAALVYLSDVDDRPNLEIRAGTEVHSVVVQGNRATGVRLTSGEVIPARQVVLSAGSYNTPTILMRSGIGPAEHLKDVGIDVVVDNPAVGANLKEHPTTAVVYAATAEQHDEPQAPLRTMLTLKTDPAEPDADIHIHAVATSPTQTQEGHHPTGYDFRMTAGLVAPRSTGSVRLRSREIGDPPVIDTGVYRDPEDVRRVVDGARVIWRLAESTPLAEILVAELVPGPAIAASGLEDAVRAVVGTYNHPVGTCRMGPGGVVDERCRVHGVADLVVIDASVFPVSSRATTTLPVLMVAERAVGMNWGHA
ncbi:choline dehydrogenase [Actinokineospora auranticolor]|uniref:Choline dehydrogenase n=1 Tax=Actinokineospora auranticolor TaxID=155976 RepID=A0A2S6GFE1_9PSEU|nr:choline dehydrogenase [Actinokineospora auranticolor]